MKSKIISILMGLSILVSLLKPAHAFTVNARVWWDQLHAIATVQNFFPRPIICSGNAQGITASGRPLFNYMNGYVIMPGTFGQIHVYTNIYDPFISAHAFVNCNWL